MFRLGDPDPWSWETTDGSPVEFLVWALVDDGLRVGQFDAHPEGNRRLRAAGMDEEGWRSWLGAVVAAHVAASSCRSRIAAALRPMGGATVISPEPGLTGSAGHRECTAAWRERGNKMSTIA
jgi:hypothetical protein